uniref:Major sperm protein n=1 Tax=Acrobeloides nanus TaxID=290746 RepID=A0A914DN02_9BILA
MDAAYENQIEIVRYLLEKGADLNRKDMNGSIALHYAAQNKNDNKLIVELLLKHGADIEHQNTEGETCLMTASSRNNIEVVCYLLEKGADSNIKDKYGRTALFYVVNENKLIVKLLLEHGADIEHQNTKGVTCLMYASYNNRIEIVRYLLKKGADVNRKDKNGSTALHYAARNKNDNKLIVELLLKHGADIEHQNTEGETCLMTASSRNNIEVVRYLLEKGADSVEKFEPSVPPGDIQTQPNAKIVFNSPYDDKHTNHIKIINSSARRIGWAIKTNNTVRLEVDPPCGVLDPKEAVLMAVSCDAFDFDSEDTSNDHITVEWTNTPERAANQFRREWFQGIVRHKNLSIEYNS